VTGEVWDDPLRPGVTVVTPSIPPRAKMLRRALASVVTQTRPADAISVAIDRDHEGSAATRNRALEAVGTEWAAFLDDDDQFLPHHLELLLACAEQTGADVVYPIPEVEGRPPPVLRFGLPFDPVALRQANYIPVTSLVRTRMAQISRFRCPRGTVYDDWGFYLGLLNINARFVHLPEKTWVWNWHPGNTQGQPDRW
jgi:glycosyltransferase involved in cell wall biosynthesis